VTGPFCGLPAAVHIISRAPGWGLVALFSCAGHADIARAGGIVLTEHPYRQECTGE
jgi:hypothetical protein